MGHMGCLVTIIVADSSWFYLNACAVIERLNETVWSLVWNCVFLFVELCMPVCVVVSVCLRGYVSVCLCSACMFILSVCVCNIICSESMSVLNCACVESVFVECMLEYVWFVESILGWDYVCSESVGVRLCLSVCAYEVVWEYVFFKSHEHSLSTHPICFSTPLPQDRCFVIKCS